MRDKRGAGRHNICADEVSVFTMKMHTHGSDPHEQINVMLGPCLPT